MVARLASFFASKWRWLLAAAALVLLGVQVADYATAWYRRRHLQQAQAQAEAWHNQQQAAAVARYTGYRLDSVRRATERQALLRQLRNLEKQDDSFSKNRPGRIRLPAWDELPCE